MRRKRALPNVYIAAVLVLMYVPILLVIAYSFNQSRVNSVWTGFSLKWYAELFDDRSMFEALRNSLILALSSSVCAAVIGTLGAVGMADRSSKARHMRVTEYVSTLPIMIPEIILGMVLLVYFSFLRLPFGMLTLTVAHTSFCIPYVYLMVKARLAGIDKSYIEAARDLGAGGARAFWDVTLPLIVPSVASGMLLSFAMSFDDVIISVFVTGVNVNTLPIKIYTQLKTGVSPKINAMCTLLFAATVLLGLASAWIGRPKRHGRE